MFPGLGAATTCPNCLNGWGVSARAGLVIPSSGILRNLIVTGAVDPNNLDPTISVQIFVNYVESALACTLTLPTGNATLAQISCSDSTDSVSVNAGDIVQVSLSTTTPTRLALQVLNVALENTRSCAKSSL
jgi:hypothetical protein